MGFVKNAGIRQPLQSLIAEMNGVIPIPEQPLNDPSIDAHIRQKSHRLLV